MGDQRPRINARVLRWAMYDIASSNYHAIVPAFFGLYFLSLAGTGHAAAKAGWGVAVATSLLAAAVLAPLVGAWADRTGRWFGALLGLTGVCVLGTLLLPLTARAGVFVGCLLFVIAQTGYTVASSVYDSLVVDVAPASHRGRASAIGWALGLVGGLASTFAALALVDGYSPNSRLSGSNWRSSRPERCSQRWPCRGWPGYEERRHAARYRHQVWVSRRPSRALPIRCAAGASIANR
jgi:MFS-type transporter involved in bile tolerance (Atg22 family)